MASRENPIPRDGRSAPIPAVSPRTPDRYRSFGALASHQIENVDFRRELCARPSGTAVVAIHGGGIEPGTAELARAIAGDDLSWYCFEGIKPRDNGVLHVASTRFDDPLCLSLVSGSDLVLAIHGSEDLEAHVRVSGLEEDLVRCLIGILHAEGFPADHDRGACAGADPRNICNRGLSGRGIQVEVSRGLRLTLFRGLSRRDRQAVRPAFSRLVAAIRSAVLANATKELPA